MGVFFACSALFLTFVAGFIIKFLKTMKKIIVMTGLMLVTANVFAQRAVGSVNIQPKVGIGIASMTNVDLATARTTLTAGAEAEYQVTDIVSLSGGALYSQQGVKGSEAGASVVFKLDYVNVPLLVNCYVTKGLAMKLGLQPGFLVNDKVRVEAGGVSSEIKLAKFFEAAGVPSFSINSFVVSVPIGMSYEIKNVQFDARYNFGVSNAFSVNSENVRHNVFQFTVGYKFGL